MQDRAEAQDAEVQAPRFEVDPFWPKPLPNHWLLGSTIGVWVDEQDHIWIIHRSSATLAQQREGRGAQPADRRMLPRRAAGARSSIRPATSCGPGAVPARATSGRSRTTASIVDHKGNVWIGGNGEKDAHILKFTKDGKFLHAGRRRLRARQLPGSNDQENFGRVAKILVDPKTNEAYLADGYLNKRVAVLDADTGKMKRYWGAYGNKPDDADLGPYDPEGAAGAAVPQPGALRRACRTTGSSTCATASTTGSRSSARTASS